MATACGRALRLACLCAAAVFASGAVAGDPPADAHVERVILVVPCYNEEKRFLASRYLSFLSQPDAPRVSFLFVNDGSTDGTLGMLRSLEARAEEAHGSGRIAVLDLQPNGGKAEAVRRGLLATLGGVPPAGPTPPGGATPAGARDVVGFWDGDLATPLAAVPDLLGVLHGHEEGPGRLRCGDSCREEDGDPAPASVGPPPPRLDMVFGARVGLLGRDVTRSLSRHYLGRVFATLASVLLGLPIYDTQCGAKLFRATGELRQALADPFSAGWIFDVELLARLVRAYRAGGRELRDAVFEYPLHRWHDLPGSKLGLGAKVGALGGLARIWVEHFSPWAAPWPAAPTAPSAGAAPEAAAGEL